MTAEDSPHDSYEQKRKLDRHFAGGLAWTAGAKWATQLVSWASLVVLAHLLSLADYGIGDMAGIFFVMTTMLAEFGVGNAVLHMPELDDRALGQLNSFSFLLCTAMFVAAIPGASIVARFFHTPQLKAVILVGNFALFLTGLQAVPIGLLQRDMNYRRLSLTDAAQAVVQAVVSVATARMGWGYWALVFGGFAGKAVNTIMVVNWKRVSFARPVWKDIRGAVELGRQIAVSRMAWYAYTYSDGVIVGRILGHDPLGSYRMSMNLASAPAEKVSTLLMRTAGPLFANIQNDLVLVRRYYLIFAEALCLTVIPLMTGLIVLSPVAVPLVLGKQWTSAVAPLQWLSAFVILRTLSTLTDQVLMSQRLTQLSMRMSLLSLVVMPIAFYFAARSNGTVGVALSWLVLAPITILPSQIIMMRRIHLPFRDFAGAFWPAAASSAVMALGLYGVRHWAARLTLPVAASLALQIAVGCAIYALFLFVVFRAKVFRYINFVRDMRSKKDVPDSAPA